jgi:hypothetical protein
MRGQAVGEIAEWRNVVIMLQSTRRCDSDPKREYARRRRCRERRLSTGIVTICSILETPVSNYTHRFVNVKYREDILSCFVQCHGRVVIQDFAEPITGCCGVVFDVVACTTLTTSVEHVARFDSQISRTWSSRYQ